MINTIPAEPVDFSAIIAAYFPNTKPPVARPVVPDADKSFFQRVNDCAMADLGAWVPILFPQAERARTGYRVRSHTLGRDLEEDLSIQPEGIVDFGLHDMGDENEGKRTPVALVMEHTEMAVQEAALWLCEQCGLEPAALGWVEVLGAPAAPEEFQNLEPLQTPVVNFVRNKKGQIEATIENAVKAVRTPSFCGAQVAFDTFRDEIMLAPPENNTAWRPITDHEYTGLRITLERKGFRPVGRELIRDAVDFVATTTSFDSAVKWLEALDWDGVPRVETFLHKYFNAEDSEYIRATSRYTWTALAGRILTPGCQADMMPILVGAQGLRKTTGVRTMAPSTDNFFEVHFDTKEDDIARQMRGKIIGEVGELRGLHTKEIEHIKSFISRRKEEWVPKFKEFAHSFMRRCLFIGTTNKEEFLADETGERRMLPVVVGLVDVEGIKRDRNQLWAEAKVLYLKQGIEWQEAERLAPEVHGKHKITDGWSDNIQNWLEAVPDFDNAEGKMVPRKDSFFTIAEVWQSALGKRLGDMNRQHELRIGKILRHLGYDNKPKRIGGQQRKVWVFVGSKK